MTGRSCTQKTCGEKIFQHQSMSNAMTCFDQRFAVKNSGVYSLASLFDSSNPNIKIPASKQLVQVCKVWPIMYLFFGRSIRSCGRLRLVKASSSESGDLVLIPARYWNSLQQSPSVPWLAHLYIAVLCSELSTISSPSWISSHESSVVI